MGDYTRAYGFELGLPNGDFIQFGYWGSLKKGLLAGERLAYDLKRMCISCIELDQREYEVTRTVSLAQLALIQLKETAECFFALHEALYDLDFPGHYHHRPHQNGLAFNNGYRGSIKFGVIDDNPSFLVHQNVKCISREAGEPLPSEVVSELRSRTLVAINRAEGASSLARCYSPVPTPPCHRRWLDMRLPLRVASSVGKRPASNSLTPLEGGGRISGSVLNTEAYWEVRMKTETWELAMLRILKRNRLESEGDLVLAPHSGQQVRSSGNHILAYLKPKNIQGTVKQLIRLFVGSRLLLAKGLAAAFASAML
ncbi:hypothetical protein BKA65DRAFT_485927 [Rhexocercosporidium sp. MPI-PUGE-AT-0058]|nr:hypothetical protein BKA65DRAFT_485927 [Rhexocercosporidium sp. MPI-PUGE-AT-0058]